jgi:hypothetical protein
MSKDNLCQSKYQPQQCNSCKSHFKPSCVSCSQDRKKTLEENRKKFIIQNPSQQLFQTIHIDGCQIQDPHARCDYMVTVHENNTTRHALYIELKGVDIEKAASQLEETIKSIKIKNTVCKSYIVCTKVSPSISTKIQILKEKFQKNYKSTLEIKNNQIEVNLDSL